MSRWIEGVLTRQHYPEGEPKATNSRKNKEYHIMDSA